MITVFNLQWLRLKREPALVLAFLIMNIAFAFFMVGSGGSQVLTVKTYSDSLSQPQMEEFVERLNETDTIDFQIEDRERVEEEIKMSQIAFALELEEDGYSYLVGQESQFLPTVNQHVEKVYRTHFSNIDVEVKEFISLETSGLLGGVTNSQESNANVITGMTLYFCIFTVLFGMMNIAQEKRSGTWHRLISTPFKKTQIYMGLLLHYFCIGILQIGLSFFIFHQFLNYDFGGQYLAIIAVIMAYVFALVSLGMLVISLVKTPQQLQAVIPIVATGTAMLGGAMWPIEIVSNSILLVLARLTPIFYGMDGLKDAILYNRGLGEILQPISILLLMGVLFMGLGLNLLERSK